MKSMNYYFSITLIKLGIMSKYYLNEETKKGQHNVAPLN